MTKPKTPPPKDATAQDARARLNAAVERMRYTTGIGESHTLLSDIIATVRADERAMVLAKVEELFRQVPTEAEFDVPTVSVVAAGAWNDALGAVWAILHGDA